MALRRTIFYSGKGGKDQSAINAAISGMASIFDGTKRDLKKIAKQAGDIILNNTLPITPMDTGALRESGKVEVVDSPTGYQARVSFGGGDVDYAVIVHEDLEDKNWTTPGTGPLYLKEGTAMSVDEIKALLVAGVQQSLKKGAK